MSSLSDLTGAVGPVILRFFLIFHIEKRLAEIIKIVVEIMSISGMIKRRDPGLVLHIPVKGSAKTLLETNVEITRNAGTPHAIMWKFVERAINELKIKLLG